MSADFHMWKSKFDQCFFFFLFQQTFRSKCEITLSIWCHSIHYCMTNTTMTNPPNQVKDNIWTEIAQQVGQHEHGNVADIHLIMLYVGILGSRGNLLGLIYKI